MSIETRILKAVDSIPTATRTTLRRSLHVRSDRLDELIASMKASGIIWEDINGAIHLSSKEAPSRSTPEAANDGLRVVTSRVDTRPIQDSRALDGIVDLIGSKVNAFIHNIIENSREADPEFTLGVLRNLEGLRQNAETLRRDLDEARKP